jgi:hypothetical protein
LVERGFVRLFGAQAAVESDCEAMRFIAQPLEQLQGIVGFWQQNRFRFFRNKNFFFALGQADYRDF